MLLATLLLAAPTQISNVTLSDAETAAATAATLSAAAAAAAIAKSLLRFRCVHEELRQRLSKVG